MSVLKPQVKRAGLSKLRASAWSAVGLMLLLACPEAELRALAQAGDQRLKISAGFQGKDSVAPGEPIELRLSRPLRPWAEKLAVFIGQTDMTGLFVTGEHTLAYHPTTLPLPAGENDLIVYLVSPANEWREIASFPLRVSDTGSAAREAEGRTQKRETPAGQSPAPSKPRRLGFDQLAFTPALTLSMKAQSAILFFPDFARPDRINFTDLTMHAGLQSEVARGPFSSQGQFDVVGVSFQREALRFGELGMAAPQVDLSSYLTRFQVGGALFSVGHFSFGANRHLINGFSSRGLTLTVPIEKRLDVSFAAMNGTSTVGWDNFFGLQKRKHKVISGTLGYEFLPERPGGLRLELSLLSGSRLPFNNFNQRSITDAERSRGVGLRLRFSDQAQRLRIDGGFARSRFTNPSDPLLDQGFDVVPVRAATRGAYHFDVSYEVLRNFPVTEKKAANLSLGYRLERVDPLFRSVAAFVQADLLQNQVELAGSVGQVNLSLSHFRSTDNLAGIPSVLKTLLRRNNLSLGLPLASVLGDPATPSAWLPRVSYGYDRTHAFAAALPANGGFELNVSTAPDQLSTNHNAAAEWQKGVWRFAYLFNHSFQDNRQPGRERSDLQNLSQGFTFGSSPFKAVDLGFDANTERAHNRETGRTDSAWRAGLNLNWRVSRRSAFAANLSSFFTQDAARTSRSRSAEFDAQWSCQFGAGRERFKKVRGQLFVRYANRYAFSRDSVFRINNLVRLQTAIAGLSFTFFN